MSSVLPRARDIVASAPHIDCVGATERAAALSKRSIKQESKRWGLRTALSMVDLTTLEGMDTPGKVRSLCAKARRPWESDPSLPSVAAVCVYPTMVPVAVKALAGTSIQIASVATAFPSGKSPLELRLSEVRWCVDHGAHEIDMVIDRGAFLAGEYALVFDEIAAIKAACGAAHLKVILETGELGSYDRVRQASDLAMHAGGDFIKTSTGKVPSAATLPVTLVMLEAIRDFFDATGRAIGMKPAGGIRSAKQALQYLVLVNETLGERWLDPALFRLGASSLVNDILRQLSKDQSGRYASHDYFPLD